MLHTPYNVHTHTARDSIGICLGALGANQEEKENDMINAENFKSLILRGLKNIPEVNIRRYKEVCNSYMAELEANPFDGDELAGRLRVVIEKYQRQDMSRLPPELCRFQDEDADAWLDRCYEKMESGPVLAVGPGAKRVREPLKREIR